MSINDAAWRKSSYSGDAQSSECVEVAPLEAVTGVRDTKARDRGHLEASPVAWSAFLGTLRQ
ncbi:DUF397 domain-containing protein [Uniformispora flossi]|uniref:DUF397 domain-containing protein n=1 Tax=Uniformispora flossi TaxID=3390723 RepID=UPI003C2FDF82